MEYDESLFRKKANKKAVAMWLIISAVLTTTYLIECFKGKRTVPYTVIFLIICWVPIIFTFVCIRIRGWATKICKETIATGYGVFFAFVVLTGFSQLTCMYVYPVASMLTLYKDKFLMIRISILNFLLIIVRLIKDIATTGLTSDDITEYEIVFGLLVLNYMGYVMSISHTTQQENALLGSIKANLN